MVWDVYIQIRIYTNSCPIPSFGSGGCDVMGDNGDECVCVTVVDGNGGCGATSGRKKCSSQRTYAAKYPSLCLAQ